MGLRLTVHDGAANLKPKSLRKPILGVSWDKVTKLLIAGLLTRLIGATPSRLRAMAIPKTFA